MAEEYTIHLNIEKVENGQYLATSEALPGLVAQGRTIAETMEIAQDVARKLLDSYTEHGDPIPKTKKRTTIPNHPGDIPEGMSRRIMIYERIGV
jgi:antitoxin HicB